MAWIPRSLLLWSLFSSFKWDGWQNICLAMDASSF